jgi:hypothetical protein
VDQDHHELSAFDQLCITWAKRDALYAALPKPMSEAQIEAARMVRKVEVRLALPPKDRARAWARVKTWYPPEHGQGLS